MNTTLGLLTIWYNGNSMRLLQNPILAQVIYKYLHIIVDIFLTNLQIIHIALRINLC